MRIHQREPGQKRAARVCPRRWTVETLEDRCLLSGDIILRWNAVALDAVKNDYDIGHTPDQGGPTPTSRALAIVHAAMFDAINSIDGRFTPYLSMAPNARGASIDAAVGQAGRDTLVALFPQQTAMFNAALADTLAGVPNGRAENRGIAVGQFVATAMLAARANDGSDATSDYHTIGKPGHHQPDPLHPDQGFLTTEWGSVTPFAMPDVNQFLSQPPAALGSTEYAAAFAEAATLGGDSVTTPTLRTAEQTQTGIFWGYDGSPGLGVPPRLYNQIIRIVAEQQHNTVFDNARLFALANIAMADGGIQSWDAKYVYDFWRPVVAIRAANTDGNPLTTRDADWTPLGAPRSNAPGETNFTPPFPAYTSGHATFGAAAFRTLANFYGRDNITFSFTSDEFNGVTHDQNGSVRPVVTHTFHSLSAAAEENGQSRIYLGIHWSFDKVHGIQAGNAIADFAFANFLRPRQQLTAAATAPDPVNETLSAGQVQPLLTEAIARWHGAGVDTSSLNSIDVRITDLPGATLGEAVGHTIWLDTNAAGWGWFVDATPSNDSEYLIPGDQGEQGRMDLLTAIAHELGHILGYEHSDDGTMHDTLATGERHTPTSSFGVLEPILVDLVLCDKKKAWVTEPLANDPLHDLVALLE